MTTQKVSPQCHYFGQCGGCQYQDLPYSEQLKKKENEITTLLQELISQQNFIIQKIIPSPLQYQYRHRLDLSARRRRYENWNLGFYSLQNQFINIQSCSIAMPKVNHLLKNLITQLPTDIKHHRANITIKTDPQGQIHWGGIGKKSCLLQPKDYFYIDLNNIRIFYSLESFFQANLAILPLLSDFMNQEIQDGDILYDLYGGVGLFSFILHHKFKKIHLIETSFSSCQIAQHAINYNQLEKIKVFCQNIEEYFKSYTLKKEKKQVAIIDPPRKGLSMETTLFLRDNLPVKKLYYLSCNPQTLVRDLALLTQKKWQIDWVQPFDFFPQTQHIETLVGLSC